MSSCCCCVFLPAWRPERLGFSSAENRTARVQGAEDPKRLFRMIYMIFCFDWSIGGCWCRELLRVFFSPNWGFSNLEKISQIGKRTCTVEEEDLKRWIHTWHLVCGLKWSSSQFTGSFIRWKLFMPKTKKELYKTDKEQTQLIRLEDIDNHAWYFVFAEVEFWSLLYTLDVADVEVGIGEPNKKGLSSCLEV